MNKKHSRKYNSLVADETIEDYSLRYTPKSFRKWSELLIANTALGSISFLALEAIGASIAMAYGFNTAFWAIFTASLIIFITAIPISYYAAKYNIDIDLITRSAGFGYVGSTFTSLIYASFSFIFFALEAAIMSQALELYFGLPLYLGYIVSSLIIIPLVFYGITLINKLQLLTQPIWIIMMLAPFVAIILKEPDAFISLKSLSGSISGSNEFNFYYFGFAVGISLSLIAQIGEQVDYLRFMPPLTKNNRVKWWFSMLIAGPGWIILGFLKQIGGMFLAAIVLLSGFSLTEAKTPIEMYNVGYTYLFDNPQTALIAATIFVIISQIKINVTNAYAGSLAWSNFFSRITHSHPGRVVWMIFNIFIALLLMELGLFEVLSKILGLYSNVAIAWIGALFADLVINKPLGLSPKIVEFKRAYLYNVNPVGVGSMGIASVVSILAFIGLFGDIAQSYSAFIAMVIAIVLSPLIAYITKGKYYIARENSIALSSQTHYNCEICNHSYEKDDMVFCPLNAAPICSLCCSLNSLCHDECKLISERSLRKRFSFFISTFFKNFIAPSIVLKIVNFSTILFILFFLVGIIAWMSISMQIESIPPEYRDLFIGTIINYSVVIGIIMSIISWWILLLQDSRQRAEQLLENEKERFEAIYKSTRDAIAIIDLDSSFLQVNPAYTKITGYTQEELFRTSCIVLTIEKDRESSRAMIEQVIEDGYIENYEKGCFFKDGSIGTVNISMTMLHNPERILMSVRDVTKEKEDIRNFEYLLNNTIETIGIFQNGICVDINEAGLNLFAFSEKSEAIGQSALDFIAPHFQDKVKEHIKNGYEELYEVEAVKKDGTFFPVLLRGKLTYIHGVLSRVTSLVDLSELKRKEKSLEIERRKAEEATRLKSQFLANMSHEIRTPMNGIMGMAHLALQSGLNEKQKYFVEKIDRSAKNLLGILNDILDFSKVEAGKMTIEKINFNLEDMINEIMTLLKIGVKEKSLNFSIFYEREGKKDFFADKLRIAQVLTNILSNAIKFTKKGGSVELFVSKQGNDFYRFEIKDTGIGLSELQVTKLFHSFTQADGSTTRKYGGTGLGLAISKQLVELMGGKIWVESQVDVGSSFIFEIPLQELEESVHIEKREEETDIRVLQGSSILLVEDNETNQEIIIGLLEHSGIEIDIAYNGVEAIEFFDKKEYELILMDIQMPIMDGYEATTIIREKNREIPIIALSANAMKEDAIKSKKIGMNEHLNKPIEIEKLYEILLKYIKKKVVLPSNSNGVDENIKIPNFKNIDRELGLRHLGGKRKLYIKVLEDFRDKYEKIDFNDLNTSAFKREIHTLKGLSANIGAMSLHAIVNSLNEREERGDLGALYGELSLVIDELEGIHSYEDSEKKYLLALSDEKREELEQKLLEALLSNRPKNCETIFDEIGMYELENMEKQKIQDVKDLVQKYKFSQAVSIMKEH